MSQILLGARAIAKKLKEIGLIPPDMPDETAEDRVYYMARKKQIPVGRFGNQIISTPNKLQEAVDKLVS